MAQPPVPTPRISSVRKNDLIKLLESQGVRLDKCIRCNVENVDVFDFNDYSEIFQKDSVQNPTTPHPERRYYLAVVTCKLCGYRSEFDLNVLQPDRYPND